MSGLTRKKIKVKGKGGKTYMRNAMVRSGQKAGRKPSGLLMGKTGSGTSFKHGLAAGAMLGLAGAHRMGMAGMVAAGAQRGVSHVTTHQSLKKAGQHGRTFGQKVKHFLANEVGQSVGALGGALAHEGTRRLGGYLAKRRAH